MRGAQPFYQDLNTSVDDLRSYFPSVCFRFVSQAHWYEDAS